MVQGAYDVAERIPEHFVRLLLRDLHYLRALVFTRLCGPEQLHAHPMIRIHDNVSAQSEKE